MRVSEASTYNISWHEGISPTKIKTGQINSKDDKSFRKLLR